MYSIFATITEINSIIQNIIFSTDNMNQWRENKQEEGRGNMGGPGLLSEVKARRARTGGDGRQQQLENKRKDLEMPNKRQPSRPKQNIVGDQKHMMGHQNFKMDGAQVQKGQAVQRAGGAANPNLPSQKPSRRHNSNHVNMGPPESKEVAEEKNRRPQDLAAPESAGDLQMPAANRMLREPMDRGLLRDTQQAIRESQIGLMVDQTLEKHNSWYEEEGKKLELPDEDDGFNGGDMKMLWTRSVEKHEFNNVLDISSIRLADSEQQQKFGASIGQQASPQVQAFVPSQFNPSKLLLDQSDEQAAYLDVPLRDDLPGSFQLQLQADKVSKAGSGLARTHKQFFNKTMKVSEINKISNQEAADGVSSQNPQNFVDCMQPNTQSRLKDGVSISAATMGPECPSGLRTAKKANKLAGQGIELFSGSDLKVLGGPHLQLSSAPSQKFTDELNELNSALNNGCIIEKDKTNSGGEVYNILNISKDDEESIINLLKDYVTLKLGNGREIQIPKLNLAVLSSNLPDHIQFEISQQMIHNNNQNILMQNQQPNLQISSAISNITGEPQQMIQTASIGQDVFQAELSGLAIGGSRLNQQVLGDPSALGNLQSYGKQQPHFANDFNEILNKSSAIQATSASALQQLQSQANKSSFNNTTTQEEAQIAVNQTTNNTKSTQQDLNNRMLLQTALSNNQEARAGPRDGDILVNCQSRDSSGDHEPGQAMPPQQSRVADVARRTVNELSEFADLINDLNATDNDNIQQNTNTISLNDGILHLQDDLGVEGFNMGSQGERQWQDRNFVLGLNARPTTSDDKIDESQLINMIRIDDEEYSNEQGAVFIQEQPHGGPSLSSRRSSSSQVVNELDRQFSHIDITNSGESSGEKVGCTPGLPGQDLNTAICDVSAQRITSGLISKPVDIFDHGDVFVGPENFFNGESPITSSNVAKLNQKNFADQLMIDQQDKENNIFTNEMFDQGCNQFDRKLSSVSSFKPVGSASQRSSKPIGKLFIGNNRQSKPIKAKRKDNTRQDNVDMSQITKHSLVSNQRPVNSGPGADRNESLKTMDAKKENFLDANNKENYDFKAQQMMFDMQVENDIRNDSFQKQQNNRWQRMRRQDFSDFYDNNSDTLNLNERTGEIEEEHQNDNEWQANEEEQLQLYEGPSGLFDRQGFAEDDQLHREFIDLCEQDRVNSFENTYNQELARDLTYIEAHGGYDFTSHQNQSLQLGADNTMLQQHPPRHFFDQINNSVMLKDHSSRKNRMTILDRKNNVRHRLIDRQAGAGKQMLDMTHPGIVLAGSSKNDYNNLSASLGDQWWDANDDQFSIGKEDEDERATQEWRDQQKRKAIAVGKKQKSAGVSGQRMGLVGRGTVKANSRINCRSRRWVDVSGANDVFHAGTGNFTPMASNNRNRVQAALGGHEHKGNNNKPVAKRNNFIDEARSNLSNISMLNENNHSLKGGAGGERTSLKSRSFNHQSLKAKQSSKSRYAAQKVLMDRSQNIGEMLRGGPKNTLLLKNTIQQPICSPTEPSFIRFQSQRSCNSLSKAGAGSGNTGGARSRHKSSLVKPNSTTRKAAQHDCYLNSPISKKLKKKGNQPTSTISGARHHSGDNKKPRLLQNNNRNQYYQQQQQQLQTQTSNQGRSATAGVRDGSTTMGGGAAGTTGTAKGTSLMQRSINVRSKSGKTSDGGGATNTKLNTSMNAGGGGYGPRKQVMSLSRRGVPGGGAQTSFNQGQPSLNGKHQFQSHRSQKSKKSSNQNGMRGKKGAASRQQQPDLDSSSKSIRQSERLYRNAGARSRGNTTAENASARHGPYQLSKANYNSAQNRRNSGQNQEKYQRGRNRSKDSRSDQEELHSNEKRQGLKELDSNGRGGHIGNSAYGSRNYQSNSNRKANDAYSLDQLRQVVTTHASNNEAQPTIIQFNNVKDAVISVGISSNGRIIDPHSNSNVFQPGQGENATSGNPGSRNAIIIARRDQQNRARESGSADPEDGYGIHDLNRPGANDSQSKRQIFQSFGMNTIDPEDQLKQQSLFDQDDERRSRDHRDENMRQQNSVCDAFLKDAYVNGAQQKMAYDANVYHDAADGDERRPYDNRRHPETQQESRPSNENSFRKDENAGQGAKNLAQSYGAKLPLKIQLKPNSTNSSRQSKHSTNSAAVRQNQKMSGGGAVARGEKNSGVRHPINEMVIQQNYNCSPKPRSVAANASIDQNNHNYGPMSEANGDREPQRASQRGKHALSYGKAPKSQQARPDCQTETEQQQPLISAKKVIAKSVRSSQNKKINLAPTSTRDSERGGKQGQLDGNDCDDARAKFLLQPTGPLSVHHQMRKHGKRSREEAGPNDDGTDYQERKMDALNGLGSCKSGGAQIAYNSTDSKANKKKIDIKNLINQSKIKRLQNNLKQQKQVSQQPPGDSNSRIRLNLEKKSDDFGNDFKSEDHAVSSNSNNVFGRFSGANKDVTSLGSQGVNAQLYGQGNERFSNQTTTCNQQSQTKGTFAPSTTQREQELMLLQTKLEVAELERDQVLQKCDALDKLCRSQQRRIVELEELLLLSKNNGELTTPSQQLSTDVNYLTVPSTQEVRSNPREANPSTIVGQLTQQNAELQQENRKLLESLQVLVARLSGHSELNQESSLSNKSKQVPDGHLIDQHVSKTPAFQVLNELFRGSSSINQAPQGMNRNLKLQQTTSTGLNSRRSNTLEKGAVANSNNDSNSKTISHNYYFPTAKSTNSIKPSSRGDSGKGAQTMAPTPNIVQQTTTTAGVQKHHIRLTNIQLNLAASKVLKKKGIAEYASNSHQNSTAMPDSAKKGNRGASTTHGSNPGSKTLLQPNKGSLVLNPNMPLDKSKIQLQQSKRSGNIMKQNLIRVKQAQIDFQRHQQSSKQPLNIRLVPSGKTAGERSSGGQCSKRIGQQLKIQKQQTTLNGQIGQGGKPRNYSSDTQKKPKTEVQGENEMDANFKSNLSRLSDANAKLGSERTNSLKNKKITLQGNVLKKKSIKIKLASRDPSKESVDVTPADVQRLAIKDVVLNSNMLGGNGSLLANSSSQKKNVLSGAQINQKQKNQHFPSQNWNGAINSSMKQDYEVNNGKYMAQTETGSSNNLNHNKGKRGSFPSTSETQHKLSVATQGGGVSGSESNTKESLNNYGQISHGQMSGLTQSLLQSAAAKDQHLKKKLQLYNLQKQQEAQTSLMEHPMAQQRHLSSNNDDSQFSVNAGQKPYGVLTQAQAMEANQKYLQIDRLQNQVALSKDNAPSATSSTHRSQSQKALLLRQQLLQQQQTMLQERRSDRIGGRDGGPGQDAGGHSELDDDKRDQGRVSHTEHDTSYSGLNDRN